MDWKDDSWRRDEDLKSDLSDFVKRNFKRVEILDFVERKYPLYTWSLRTLGRRLKFFNIKFVDDNIDLGQVERAIQMEMDGPGRLLGYRSLHKKLREIHGLNVSRNLVYRMLQQINPEGLQGRGNVGLPRRRQRNKAFSSKGSDYTMSLDGHDKLCGYQKSMFPLCIYGGLDTFSGRMNILRIWTTNNKPEIVGRFYFEYLYEHRILPSRIRIDRGTETAVMATMHCFLRDKEGDLDKVEQSVIYGPSTENKIERWWRELHERLEKFYKKQLNDLLESGSYNPTDEDDRSMIAFIYVPLLQRELDIFKDTIWNNHRGRKQKNKELPAGIPEHIYQFPERYGGVKCGINVSEDDLEEVAKLSKIFDGTDDYLEPEFRQKCEDIIPDISEVQPSEAANAFLYLKANFQQ